VTSLILFGAMTLMGTWIGSRAEEGLTQRAASATVLEMDGRIQPLVQSLAQSATLPEQAQAALSVATAANTSGHDFAGVRIWSPSNTVVYNAGREIIAQADPADRLGQAFHGLIVADYAQLQHPADAQGPPFRETVLNAMAPVRESGSQRIIAVVEYYERHGVLQAALQEIRLHVWLAIASLSLAMIALVFFSVIRPARKMLAGQGRGLVALSQENTALQDRLRTARRQSVATNEAFLRRVSAELHDAPAQMIGFALLRLDALRPRLRALPQNQHDDLEVADDPKVFQTIRRALVDSLNEIRNISIGLAAPELVGLSLPAVLDIAVARHVERTGSAVSRDLGELPKIASPELKLCTYRFVQEGLNNAFKHAAGSGQAVRARLDGALLEIAVSDDGPGFIDHEQSLGASSRIGLTGLRARIEALGGTFEIQSQPGHGTHLIAHFALSDEERADV
jgi:signal transduction histidine kinase